MEITKRKQLKKALSVPAPPVKALSVSAPPVKPLSVPASLLKALSVPAPPVKALSVPAPIIATSRGISGSYKYKITPADLQLEQQAFEAGEGVSIIVVHGRGL